jgi:hypothetical protein
MRSMSPAPAYRSLDELALARARSFADTSPARLAAARRVYARRVARIAGGATGLAAGLALFAAALVEAASSSFDPPHGLLTRVLLAALALSALAWTAARAAAPLGLRRALRRAQAAAAPTGDPARDLAAAEQAAAPRIVERLASRLESASIALPMAAASFLLPLTLHFLVAEVLDLGDIAAFDRWIVLSVVVVGHAHAALAICCALLARRARKLTAEELRARGATDWGVALAVATACGAVPGVLLVGIPPVVVFVTGIVFIPAMFLYARARIESERAAIAF